MDKEALKQRLAINKGNLDEEVAQQPVLFFEAAELYEQAQAECDALKEDLASTDAQLDGVVRQRLARGEKVTEAMVKNGVQLAAEHEEAFNKFLSAKTHAGVLDSLKEAFKQRGYMLRDLAQLQSTTFYEQPSIQSGQYLERRRMLAEAREHKRG